MANKINKKEWIIPAIIFPVLSIVVLFKYLSGDGCLYGSGSIICGGQVTLVVGALFLVSIFFNYIYFVRIRPEIKKQEAGNLQKILKDEFDKK
jgi:protein-S-isoprenylcysteine O-methyltransferase Ste14